MKKILAILLCVIAATAAGLYTRPSYILIGQLNWIDVITKGYNVGSVPKFFTQSMIDESFFWVLKFAGGGLLLGILVSLILGGGSKSKSAKKKA